MAYMLGPVDILTIFFVMLGPLRVLGPFAQRTRDRDEATTRQIAVRAFAVATIAAVAGGLLGSSMLGKWHISLEAMLLASGIIFFLVALRQLLEQYEPPSAAAPEALPAAPTAAAIRLVFPTVLTPYGIAAVITLLAASQQGSRTAMILGLLVLIMVLDLLAMIYAKRILVGWTMIVLQVVGAVLAVLQVALALELILRGLRALGVVAR
jgi:multiple antibiotic resistance protein